MEKAGNFGAKALFFLLPFMGLLFMRWVFDNDLWFILGSGRFVLENGFPYTEPFTMHENINFVLEQWLTDVIYWTIYNNFGVEVFMTFVLLIGFFILLVYEKLCCLLTNDNIAISKAATFIVGIFVTPSFLLTRPQILSMLIFLCEVYVLVKYAKTNNIKYLFAIPVFSLLTINLHCAVWPLIFILILPFIATVLAEKYTKIEAGYLEEKFNLKPLVITIIVSFFIAFINPYGIKAMLFLFTSYDPGIHAWISEIKPPTFGKGFGFFFILLFWGFFILAKKKIPIFLILLFFGLGFLGLMSIRNIFWFYMMGTLIFPFALKDYRFKLFQTELGFYKIIPFILLYFYIFYRISAMETLTPMTFVYMFYLAGIFISLAFFAVFYKKEDNIRKTKSFFIVVLPCFFFVHLAFQSVYSASDYKNEKYKETVDILLEENDVKDIRLFTGFNSGSYPEFRGVKGYIDGRPEIFAPKNSGLAFNIIDEYYDVTEGAVNYKDFIKKYDFTHLLVEKGDGIFFIMTPYDDDLILLHEAVDENGLIYKKGEVYARLYKVKNR